MHEPRDKTPETSVRAVLFPRHGFSATELLILANVAVAIVLVIAWAGDYRLRLLRWAYRAWASVREHGAYGMFLPTIFMHVGPEHLGKNLAGLLAGAGAVEFLAGGWWAIAVYLLTGLGAAAVSYTAHRGPPLSIGASGAIMGLVGCTVAFIVRRQRLFSYAQQWKVWRVYVPMFLLLFLPTLFNADVHAHVGGFVCGLILGFVVPPHARLAALRAVDPFQEEEAAPDPSG
jgi:rhomboid protease GluP